jgi:threonine synthase
MGFQAEGSAPFVVGHTVKKPETIATAIRIGNPANWEKAHVVKQASQGEFNAVTDTEIIEAYRLLGAKEGIFCEPASAASVAGLLKVRDQVPDHATVVCVLTGNGLKDPDNAIQNSVTAVKSGIKANLKEVAKIMGFES